MSWTTTDVEAWPDEFPHDHLSGPLCAGAAGWENADYCGHDTCEAIDFGGCMGCRAEEASWLDFAARAERLMAERSGVIKVSVP